MLLESKHHSIKGVHYGVNGLRNVTGHYHGLPSNEYQRVTTRVMGTRRMSVTLGLNGTVAKVKNGRLLVGCW